MLRQLFAALSFALLLMPVVGCNPPPQNKRARVSLELVDKGQNQIDVVVSVDDASMLFGVAFDLVYDKDVFTYHGWKNGDIWSSARRKPVVLVSLEDGRPGRLVVGCGDSQGETIKNASGSVVTISLVNRSNRSGMKFWKTKLGLDQVVLRKAGNLPLEVHVQQPAEANGWQGPP